MLSWHTGTVGVKVVPYSQEWPGHTGRRSVDMFSTSNRGSERPRRANSMVACRSQNWLMRLNAHHGDRLNILPAKGAIQRELDLGGTVYGVGR